MGQYGTCCSEMDIWESNSMAPTTPPKPPWGSTLSGWEATQITPHVCNVEGQTRCSGEQCTSTCDQAGCDWNPYRLGQEGFFGPGSNYTVDSTQKMTVPTCNHT